MRHMTGQPQGPPPFDPGNPFVQDLYPTFITYAHVNTDQGPFLLVTIRSGPATLSVHLNRDDAVEQGRRWTLAAEKVPILHVAKDGLVTPHRNGQGGDGGSLILP
jgi:hypothetical protein